MVAGKDTRHASCKGAQRCEGGQTCSALIVRWLARRRVAVQRGAQIGVGTEDPVLAAALPVRAQDDAIASNQLGAGV